MDFWAIIYAFLVISGLGCILGLGLSIAARFLSVKKSEEQEKIEQILPQLNCGACGFAGCSSYAASLLKDEAAVNLCTPGGLDVAKKIAEILGREVEVVLNRKVTQVHCKGGKGQANYKFEYQGFRNCTALYLLGGGNKECSWGCLGLGSCIDVCPVGAISYTTKDLVWVDKDKCIGCGKCIEVCPTQVMRFIPYCADFLVACNSLDIGGKVRRYCKVGCTGCKICEKRSPEGGFQVLENLARIDYNQKGSRQEAVNSCPTKCIVQNENEILK